MVAERGSIIVEPASTAELPRVSIIVPCRNERQFIQESLDSLLASDYPSELLTVIVVDGRSSDGTTEYLEAYAATQPRVVVLQNHKQTTPAALNLGLGAATGDVILRADAHARYPKDYVRKCVARLLESGASSVGGLWRVESQDRGWLARWLVLALTHPFGVGNAHYRYSNDKPRWVDTVPYFCCPRKVFGEIGDFNERLERGQDMEFYQRLRLVGGRVLLDPGIHSTYFARANLQGFARHAWWNGTWAVLPFAYTTVVPVRARHLAPLASICAVGALLLLHWARLIPLWLAWGPLATYGVVLGILAVYVAATRRAWSALIGVPMAFGLLHCSYGLGSLWGAVRLPAEFYSESRRKRDRRAPPSASSIP